MSRPEHTWIPSQQAWVGGSRDEASGRTRWHAEQGPLLLKVGSADWRALSTLHLQLRSPRRTGARIRLEVLGPDDSLLGAVAFAVDWIGENDMQLWLANFAPREGNASAADSEENIGLPSSTAAGGPPQPATRERWAGVRAVRMRCLEAGLWPTVLTVGRCEVTDRAPAWRVNDSDTVIEAGWRHVANRAEEWRLAIDRTSISAGAPICRSEEWPSLVFGFQQGPEPGRITVERRFDLDIHDQAQILCKMLWGKETRLTVSATVDNGRHVVLLNSVEAPENWLTFGADLDGSHHLDAVQITLEECENRANEGREIGARLLWILLRRRTALDSMPVQTVHVRMGAANRLHADDVRLLKRQVRQVPSSDVPDSTTPVGDPLSQGLPFGFYVGRDGLAALRERALHGAALPVFAALRAEADRALATELVDRNYYGLDYGGGIGLPKGLRGAGMRIFAPTVAMVHLITGEEKYAIAARRWVLRAARSDDWRGDHGGCVDRPQMGEILDYWDSFTNWYPFGFAGFSNHPFQVADVAYGVVVAYEMLYHCFSPAERAEIEQAFAEHGIYILFDKLWHDRDHYVRMNQGLLFAEPLLMQTAFLKDRDPVYRAMHEWVTEFLRECGGQMWNDEGVMGEGPAYGLGSVMLYLSALPPLAACLRRPLSEVVPPSLRYVLDYVQHCRSTWRSNSPRYLGLSDWGMTRWVNEEFLSFAAGHLESPVAQHFWNESYAANPQSSIPTLLFLDNKVQPAAPELPPAKIYRNQPMAFLRTGWQPGDTLVALTNIRHVTGHGHRDRASVIFEYNGEPLLLDPGRVNYALPDSAQYTATFCHNTLTFSQRSQAGGTHVYDTSIIGYLTTSGDTCPGLPGGIDWVAVDATAVYPEAARFIRHLIFLRPGIVVLYDVVEAKQPEIMDLNFSCLGPLGVEGDTFISTTRQNRLVIHSQATAPLVHRFAAWGMELPDVTTHRLIHSTRAPTQSCSFLTVLAPHSLRTAAPVIKPLNAGGVMGARIRVDDAEEIVICRSSDSPAAVCGVETDAQVAVIRRAAGKLLGAAMLNGTMLAAAGDDDALTAEAPAFIGAVRTAGRWLVQPGIATALPETPGILRWWLRRPGDEAEKGAAQSREQ